MLKSDCIDDKSYQQNGHEMCNQWDSFTLYLLMTSSTMRNWGTYGGAILIEPEDEEQQPYLNLWFRQFRF